MAQLCRHSQTRAPPFEPHPTCVCNKQHRDTSSSPHQRHFVIEVFAHPQRNLERAAGAPRATKWYIEDVEAVAVHPAHASSLLIALPLRRSTFGCWAIRSGTATRSFGSVRPLRCAALRPPPRASAAPSAVDRQPPLPSARGSPRPSPRYAPFASLAQMISRN